VLYIETAPAADDVTPVRGQILIEVIPPAGNGNQADEDD